MFLIFAEEVAKYARKCMKLSIAGYSASMKVSASRSLRGRSGDLYSEIVASGLKPDATMLSCLPCFSRVCAMPAGRGHPAQISAGGDPCGPTLAGSDACSPH